MIKRTKGFTKLLFILVIAPGGGALAQFGEDKSGFQTIPHLTGSWMADGMLPTEDGGYLLRGSKAIRRALFFKLDAAGRFDQGFNGTGSVVVEPPPPAGSARLYPTATLELERDIILACGRHIPSRGPTNEILLWKLVGGRLDATMGFRTVDTVDGVLLPMAMVAVGDRYLIFARETLITSENILTIYVLDENFDRLKKLRSYGRNLWAVRSAKMGPGGSVFVSGYLGYPDKAGFIGKVGRDGEFVRDFGIDGWAIYPRLNSSVYDLAFDNRGDLYGVAGFQSAAGIRHAGVHKFDSDTGLFAGSIASVQHDLVLEKLVAGPRGFVAAGRLRTSPPGDAHSSDIQVWVLKPDGSFDPSFDGDGVKDLDLSKEDNLAGLHVDLTGKIVLFVDYVNYDGVSPTVVRLLPDGRFDAK